MTDVSNATLKTLRAAGRACATADGSAMDKRAKAIESLIAARFWTAKELGEAFKAAYVSKFPEEEQGRADGRAREIMAAARSIARERGVPSVPEKRGNKAKAGRASGKKRSKKAANKGPRTQSVVAPQAAYDTLQQASLKLENKEDRKTANNALQVLARVLKLETGE